MNHGSLFSGIGGFDLAAEWMGWDNKFHCEWNPFGQKVLKYHFPNAISYEDITKTDFSIWRGRIDILTGGFPCQPYSLAGKRKGKEDERHLWPEMLRAIREIQPRWVVGENVLGLVNWNGGLVFHEVQAELEAERYEVLPFVLPACGVNAPHRRDRVWFVAYNASYTCDSRRDDGRCDIPERHIQGDERATEESKQERDGRECWFSKARAAHANTNYTRLEGGQEQGGSRGSRTERYKQLTGLFRTDWQEFPTQSPVCNGNDGLPAELDGITFSKWRQESVKAGGNAIVPKVALQIFKAIQQYENL